MGGGTRQEQLALGETPNLAARLQGLAAPNTLVISAATLQLLGGFFACQALGTPHLKGLAQPVEVYQVLYESTARSRLEAVGRSGLTPLVGREQEVGLLRERWAHVKDGIGQVVLLSGEAGIGKSRLVQTLIEHVATEPQAWMPPCQCSPYHQHSALYPMIDLLERVVLRFDREEPLPQKLRKLEGFVVPYGLPLAEAVPLFASLLSLPLADDYAPLTLSPEQQKQRILQALLTILLRIAAQQPVLFVMEDLHWVDPTTLELLSLLVDQGPTTRILTLLTFRPDFSPPWTGRAHLTQVTLSRLPPRQAAEMSGRVAYGKALPSEVVEQVVAKTDGVPLFVEELTKMVLESGLLQEVDGRYELTRPLPPLAIPATLHDSLMARLDRLATVKTVAQLGCDHWADVCLRAAPRGRTPGRGHVAARPAATRRGRVGVSARGGLPGHLHLQTCADPGCGVPVLAQEYAPGVPPAHCAGAGDTVSRNNGGAARTPGASPDGGRAQCPGRGRLAAGRRARRGALRQCGGDQSLQQGAGGAHHAARDAGAYPA